MSIFHITLRNRPDDSFTPTLEGDDQLLTIPLYHQAGELILISETIFDQLARHNASLSVQMWDLLRLALTVYATDQYVSRAQHGYQGWSRYLRCYIPVAAPNRWNEIKPTLETLLSFLSGDHWTFQFREEQPTLYSVYEPRNPDGLTQVCLFSGGLDSLIGAMEQIEDGQRTALISHYKRGGAESTSQDSLIRAFREHYPPGVFRHFQFYVQPMHKHPLAVGKENSQRARSFLFVCLGLAIANSLGGTVPLIIPENGLISLNVPLTITRIGSHSTRTTHPFYIHMFGQLLDGLGIETKLRNPYQFHTKGEMLQPHRQSPLLTGHFEQSNSCSHPDIMRRAGERPNQHCGYCVPCIIRRASLQTIGLEDSYYFKDIIREPPSPTTEPGNNVQAFLLALQRIKSRKPEHLLFDVLRPGPLSFFNQGDINRCIATYKRGMLEVDQLLAPLHGTL
jgi:hypothetical protein